MGMERLQELAPIVKEALHKTAVVANFLCFLHVTNTYLCTFAKLVGPSMLPSFNDGNFVLGERFTTRFGKVGLGYAVLIRSPEDPRKVVAKRVKGVEGDVVSYVVDPNIHTLWYQKDMFGLKGITFTKVVIQDILVQFLMHFYIPEFSVWYGLLRISNQSATTSKRTK